MRMAKLKLIARAPPNFPNQKSLNLRPFTPQTITMHGRINCSAEAAGTSAPCTPHGTLRVWSARRQSHGRIQEAFHATRTWRPCSKLQAAMHAAAPTVRLQLDRPSLNGSQGDRPYMHSTFALLPLGTCAAVDTVVNHGSSIIAVASTSIAHCNGSPHSDWCK